MLSVIGFLVILAPLVIVHELGHFIFAKWFRVKCETFSIGFGPTLFAKKWGETEYRVSAIPLGGYVKLLGEEPGVELPPELSARALNKQAPWKRFFVYFGGPLFNFIYAALVFMAILVIGEPTLSNKIARVLPGSDAQKAGLMSGDRIVKADGQEIKKFDDLLLLVNDRSGGTIDLTIEHTNSETSHTELKAVSVPIRTQSGYSIYGEMKEVGRIDGILPIGRSLKAGISDPKSKAAVAGMHTQDEVLAVDGKALTNWEGFEALYSRLPGRFRVVLDVQSPGQAIRKVEILTPDAPTTLTHDWGLHSAELFVDKPVADSPAQKAGIAPGDRLVSVNGAPIFSFSHLRESIQKSGEQTGMVTIEWESQGLLQKAEIVPNAKAEKDAALRKSTEFTIGVMPIQAFAEPETVVERVTNPFKVVGLGVQRMFIFSYRNVVSIGKMFTGDVSVKTLGGPILIGKIAGESLSKGLVSFLTTMAILSIGLGVLNLFPIPVLDGGHIVMLGLEVIRGKTMSLRQIELFQQVGLGAILLLMVTVMWNDILRLLHL